MKPAVARIVALGSKRDDRGGLLIVEQDSHFPFDVQGVEWFCGTPGVLVLGPSKARMILALAGELTVRCTRSGRVLARLSTPTEGCLVSAHEHDLSVEMINEGTCCILNETRSELCTQEGMVQDTPGVSSRSAHVTLPVRRAGPFQVISVVPGNTTPFPVRRLYALYDIPAGARRGSHAHRELRQLIVAAAGGFDLLLDDGRDRESVTLARPDEGVLVSPMTWRDLDNFQTGSICLVLSSHRYDESDYIRDYDSFRRQLA